MSIRPLCIFASSLSALAGHNPYKSAEDTVLEYLARARGERDLEQEQVLNVRHMIERSINPDQFTVERITERVDAIRITPATPASETESTPAASETESTPAAPASETVIVATSEVKEIVRSQISAMNGCVCEVPVLDKCGLDIRDRQCGFSKTVIVEGYGPVVLFGRVDGIEYDSNGVPVAVVEVKCRMNKFWIPRYDRDQISAYIELTGLPCRFIQQCKGEVEMKMITMNTLKRVLASPVLAESCRAIARE